MKTETHWPTDVEIANGYYKSGLLKVPETVARLAKANTLIVTPSVLTGSLRSYIIAPDRLPSILQRSRKLTFDKAQYDEEDFDSVMIWAIWESDRLREARIDNRQVSMPRDTTRGLGRGRKWFLCFENYAVLTSDREELRLYRAEERGFAPASYPSLKPC